MRLEGYPKTVTLKDGTDVTLRPMVKKDKEKLYGFFRSLTEDDRMYLRDEVGRKDTIDKWVKNLDYDRVLPILAESNGAIVADATLHRRPYGWMRHVGEIRIVVDRKYRRKGLGALLAKEIFYQALKLGLEKLVAEMAEEQKAAVRVFEALGFHREAVLPGSIVDSRGKKHNLVKMANDVDELWKSIQDYMEEEFPSYEQD